MPFFELAQLEYHGQERILQELSILAEAIQSGENLNILIRAPSGYGKTFLAHLFIEYLDRSRSNSFKYLPNSAGEVRIRQEARFHFLDEVHKLKTPEILYPLLEAEIFTFVFTTNEYDKLKEPLVNRCIVLSLEKYTIETLAWIIQKVFKKRKLNIEYFWCKELAHYCRENPRIAKATATRVAFVFQQVMIPETVEGLHELMYQMFGATQNGLTPQDREYLEALETCSGLASLKTLKGITNLPGKMIEDSIEPYLISKGLIKMTTKGRQLNG